MRIWSHNAHLQTILVKQGDRVSRGQQVATLGGTGGWSPHNHFEIRTKSVPIGAYPQISKTTWNNASASRRQEFQASLRAQILDVYADPLALIKEYALANPQAYDRFGWKFMDWAEYETFFTFHPGVDLNFGSGSADLGLPVYAIADGIVTALKESDGGWGNHLLIQHEVEKIMPGSQIQGLWSNPRRADGTGTVIVDLMLTKELADGIGLDPSQVRVVKQDYPGFDATRQGDLLNLITDRIVPEFKDISAQLGNTKTELVLANGKVADLTGQLAIVSQERTDALTLLGTANTKNRELTEQLVDALQNLDKCLNAQPVPPEDVWERIAGFLRNLFSKK